MRSTSSPSSSDLARRIAAGLLLGLGASFAQAETHVVVIEDMVFKPAQLTVKRGDTVVWRNKDMVPHTATAKATFDSGGIAANASWSWTAMATGRFDYVCLYHLGMKGELVVR